MAELTATNTDWKKIVSRYAVPDLRQAILTVGLEALDRYYRHALPELPDGAAR